MSEYAKLSEHDKIVFKIGLQGYQKGVKDSLALVTDVLNKTIELYDEKIKEIETLIKQGEKK